MTTPPTDEEAAVIVAAIEGLWPRASAVAPAPPSRDRSWRFSGRWWARPVPAPRPPWR